MRSERRGAVFWTLFGVIIPFFLLCHTWPPAHMAGTFDPIDHQEEGVRAAAANQYLHGKRPYRDIYLLYGVGNEIIEPVAVFHLFGMRLSSLRRWACVQEVVGPLALYALGLILLETPGALLALALLIAYRNPFWISFRAAWALGAMCFVMEALRRRDPKAWILAGSTCAIAFLYSKETGIIPALSVGVLLAYQTLREGSRDIRLSLAPFAIGWSIIFLPLLLWLAVTGGLRFLVHDLLHPAAGYLSIWATAAPPFAAPFRRFLHDPFLFYHPAGVGLRWWFPVFFYAATLVWSFQKPPAPQIQQFRVLTIFCGLYFLVALGRSDFEHWLKATAGYWLLLVAAIEQGWLAWSKAPWSGAKIARMIIGGLITCALAPIAFEGALLATSADHLRLWRAALHHSHDSPNASLARLGPRSLAPGELQRWAGIADRIRHWAKPGDYVYVYCDYPTLYFLCDVINPTRYADLNYIVDPRMEAEVIADLKRHPPRVIVGEWVNGQLIIPAYGQNIARYIQTYFHPADTFGGFAFYRPTEIKAKPDQS